MDLPRILRLALQSQARGIPLLLVVVVAGVLIYLESGDGGSGSASSSDTTIIDQIEADPDGMGIPAHIDRIVDGDTALATVNGRQERLRYIGIDTPESVKADTPVECFGKEAAAENARLVEGRDVFLQFGAELRDRYGRLLTYVYRDDVFINAELIRGGFAETLEISPNTDQAGLLNRLERKAADLNKGLWGAC